MITEVRDLRKIAEQFKDKLEKIRVCAFDVDGILTNGSVHWDGSEVGWNRATNTRDGYGLKILQGSGIKVGVITGGSSLSITKRFDENLGVDFVYMGNEDKREAYKELLKLGYSDEEILYMGDEFFDMPLLKRCGFAATVPVASHEVQEVVDYVTAALPGMGCAREVIDILRYARGIVPHVPDFQE